jgi:hypothetical protein
MNYNSIVFLIIFSVLIIIPSANAQISIGEAKQKSVEVSINSTGEVHVTHIINKLDSPRQIDLIDGTISNLTVKDQEGNEKQSGMIGDNDTLMIFPSNEEIIVEYDLADELILKDNVWTWDFLYLESTSFIFPEQVDLIFVNDRPAYLGEKNGIKCHGCQMILEYSLDEPKLFEKIKIQDREFLIETRTWAKINKFSFDPTSKGINFEVIGENNFVTTIVPIDFLSEPYQVFLDGEKIFFHEYINNGTHVWLNIRPQSSGEVSITGTIAPDIVILLEDEFSVEYVVVGIIIVGIVIIGVFFLKRKKINLIST